MLARNTFNKKGFFESDIGNVREVHNILESYLCFSFETSYYLIILQFLLAGVLKYTAFGYVWNEILILIYVFHYIVKLDLVEWDYLGCFIFYWSFMGFKWIPCILLTLKFLQDLKEIPLLIDYYKGAFKAFKHFYLLHFILFILF